ncbi:acyl-phosphate glycerol 3-phosphate acyltransferase [Nocardioides humilatus]|uniref:Acyl-phosphate glycerol 3-phosphate acyltransferase n=2 Tax=Nocardioides humilatus TaxID=2607660 RepID=A0A5B1LJ59_9ACTN|nr:acyl-phosphate glycerol 3-phosphate acyltransferase [Nocardioides humilatus]
MRVRRGLARGLIRATRWKLVGTVPTKGILVGAPHTSRWDFIAMLAIAWGNSARPQVLIKHTYFKGPLSWLLRALGGIPLDKGNPGATIRALLKEAEGHDSFLLVIAPEATRSKTEYWKPGFYKIAGQTGLPIGLGFIDGTTRTLGMGPIFDPSGDVVADMDMVRDFYKDKRGVHPEEWAEPRLREEGPAQPA